MATDEEYLDNLLKSLTEIEEQPGKAEENLQEHSDTQADEETIGLSPDTMDISEGDLSLDNLLDLSAEDNSLEELLNLSEGTEEEPMAAFDDTISFQEEDAADAAAEDVEADTAGSAEDVTANIVASADAERQDEESDVEEDWKADIDDLLAQADEQVSSESSAADSGSGAELDLNFPNDNEDMDLAELTGLLDKADQSESVDNDMLALLESVKEEPSGSFEDESDEAFDIFAESLSDDEGTDQQFFEENEDKPKEKRRKEKRSKKEKKNKEKASRKAKADVQSESPLEDDLAMLMESAAAKEKNDTLDNGQESSGEKKHKEKKAGLFSKVMEYLTAEEEDTEAPLDENTEILKELDEEDKQKSQKEKKKKKKADKKNKKGKGKEKEEPDNLEEEGGEEGEAAPKKKLKKEKKKKEKPPKDESAEKPVKVLSTKNMLVLVALCATLVACIIALSTFLPDYSDKKDARDAFYVGDYETVYTLLYNKKLNSSDSVIYNRAKLVLQFERKLQSYENNIALGRELEAVDALLQGVAAYQEIEGTDPYGARGEIDGVYQQICDVLLNQYGIGQEEAMEINAYDDVTYTRKLHSVVYGTEFTAPGEEKIEEPLPPQDILPEEEEIISY